MRSKIVLFFSMFFCANLTVVFTVCEVCNLRHLLTQSFSTLIGSFYDEYLKSLTAKISVSNLVIYKTRVTVFCHNFKHLRTDLKIWSAIVDEVQGV